MLELKDVSLIVGPEDNQKSLLWEASVLFPPNHLCAVVGPSGCGKSTLLKTIAGLMECSAGSIHWQGRDLDVEEDLDPHEIGYVPQFSIAYDHLTVWESVETAMRLRVGDVDDESVLARTEYILHEVGLDGIIERRVKVLSGGQKRRLALALEMVTYPALLLADEVTSGLDPKAEEEIVKVMHAMSRSNERIVLSVTHSLRHLALYDSVLVLYEGRVAYHGPGEYLLHYFDVTSPEDVFPRLTRKRPESWHNSWMKHRDTYYSTEHMMQEPGDADTPKEDDLPQEKRPTRNEVTEKGAPTEKELAAKPRPEASTKTTALLDDDQSKDEDDPLEEEDHKTNLSTPTPLTQFLVLLGRRWRIFRRDKAQLILHLALIIGFPCLVAVFATDGLPAIKNLEMGLDVNQFQVAVDNAKLTLEKAQSGTLVSGLVLFQIVLLTLMGANNSAREIAAERLIYEKEKLGGVSPLSYVLSKAVFLCGLVAVQSVWMAVFVNAICHFPGSLGQQIFLLLLVNGAMTSVCLGISSMTKSSEHASLLSIYLVGFQLPLSGAVLALPEAIEGFTRPFIAAYWGWSGFIQTMKDTRFYDAVRDVSQTGLSPIEVCIWVLVCHIFVGIFLSYLGCKRSYWE